MKPLFTNKLNMQDRDFYKQVGYYLLGKRASRLSQKHVIYMKWRMFLRSWNDMVAEVIFHCKDKKSGFSGSVSWGLQSVFKIG